MFSRGRPLFWLFKIMPPASFSYLEGGPVTLRFRLETFPAFTNECFGKPKVLVLAIAAFTPLLAVLILLG